MFDVFLHIWSDHRWLFLAMHAFQHCLKSAPDTPGGSTAIGYIQPAKTQCMEFESNNIDHDHIMLLEWESAWNK